MRTTLLAGGWLPAAEAWPVFVRGGPAPPVPPRAEFVTDATAAERVAIQRGSFTNSTFTVGRWRDMVTSPAGPRAVDVIVRDPDGTAAAAATGWSAGPGRCALLEPVGTLGAYQGRGHGRSVVLAACAALAERGAAAIAVCTPASNAAAVALYRSAGFEITGEQIALHRRH